MTIERKVGMGIAGQPSGATDVADVFSTYLYTGNSTARSINNGIDLSGEGGMVWIKGRDVARDHYLFDTERPIGGGQEALRPNDNIAAFGATNNLSSFNSNGFSLGTSSHTNYNGSTFASWTFRKKKKFFDVVTYTGNSVQGRAIPHGLGGPVGMILIKTINTGGGSSMNWGVYHRTLGGTKFLYLNTEEAQGDHDSFWNDTDATSTHFTLGDAAVTNLSGRTYVAYLFADNSSEDAEDQMIKCGSYTGNGSATGPVVDLGWEPQFLITKGVNSNHWNMWDSMRGLVAGTGDARLYPNLSNAEDVSTKIQLTPTGFQIKSSSVSINTSGVETIYMAIRAPMMVEPEAATDVFAVDVGDGTAGFTSNFPVDMALRKGDVTSTQQNQLTSRLTQNKGMYTDSTASEFNAGGFTFDSNVGWSSVGSASNDYSWMWKRAKGFMDVVCYSGNSTSGRTVAHSLGVVPEMIWIKQRDTTSDRNWNVYHKSLATNNIVKLNLADAESYGGAFANVSLPTDSNFTVTGSSQVNYSSRGYIAYLFATLAGISKVGSYTGTGSDINVDCGFSAGARFILIKRTDATGDWYVYDTARGIVAGADPFLKLNITDAQDSGNDGIDPLSSGFIVTSSSGNNTSGGNYIFYAIA